VIPRYNTRQPECFRDEYRTRCKAMFTYFTSAAICDCLFSNVEYLNTDLCEHMICVDFEPDHVTARAPRTIVTQP